MNKMKIYNKLKNSVEKITTKKQNEKLNNLKLENER